jgi:hypothetical protein
VVTVGIVASRRAAAGYAMTPRECGIVVALALTFLFDVGFLARML